MKKRKIVFYLVAPVTLALAAFLLSLFGIFDFIESAVYDILLGLAPPSPEKTLLLADSGGIQAKNGCTEVGEAMLLLKELGGKYLVVTDRFDSAESTGYGTCASLQENTAICKSVFIPIFVNSNEKVRIFEGPARTTLDTIELRNLSITKGGTGTLAEILIPPESLISASTGSGYVLESSQTNRLIRGIKVVAKYKETFLPELGFKVCRELLGNPAISIDESSLTLKNAGRVGETRRDIRIPLTGWGGLALTTSIAGIAKHARRISLWSVSACGADMTKLTALLTEMNGLGYLSFYARTEYVFDALREADSTKSAILAGNADAGMDSFRAFRELFLEETDKLLKSSAADELVSYLSKRTSGGRSGDVNAVNDATLKFKSARETLGAIQKARASIAKEANGSIIVITGVPSGEVKAAGTLAGRSAWNGMVAASVIQTILGEKYVTILPFWYAAIVSLIVSVLASFVMRRLTFLPSILVGLCFILACLIADVALFALAGWYAECVVPSMAVFGTVITTAVYGLVIRKTELFFMKASVTGKLSDEAINRIVVKPEKAHTEGEKTRVTVLASEIRAFGAIAAKMEPAKLIESLRNYHTEMSAVLLGMQATIENHEQDATVAFFGSPLAVEDHAVKACSAALRMRKLDRSLNKYFAGAKLSPVPFNTRFAIATGEVVSGNIGNDLLPDFAVVGPVTDITKQLRKVNGLYGTAIIVSESTFKEVKGRFTVRQLDRVRIARVQMPIRIYELIAEKESTPPQVAELVEFFHDALYLFEKREWRKALMRFQKALSVAPKDQVSRVYAARCKAFMKKPPSPAWDGVYKVTTA